MGKGNARLTFAMTNRGTIEITDTLTVDGGMTQPLEGVIRLNGGALILGGGRGALSGQIHGPGLVSQGGGGGFEEFMSNGQLSPGGTSGHGILTLDATSMGLGADSRLIVRIGGVEPGTQHDQLRATEALRLGGNLRVEFVSGFAPAIGQKFLIVSASPRVLTFRNDFEVIGLPARLKVRLIYVSNGVEVEVLADP